ncbi:hypothetical protein BHE74_00004356 [Ensete ventricosum]|uniref:Uncharacterized protein n=1 Tax=Ensete ventricosum TaxID=4639 RepID=A0A444EW95_ENSVE|nr:hypothetical protein B296_00021206 [Ensete ventricosum]RWW14605.1 hypothetical protein GW17_00021612 [Ensete ventricosum]RWW86853.1 hypothetical protein BHE74_00004356 [Ensete ventricosum]
MSTGYYDQASAIKAFDESKAGVKGLVDAGIITIPPFFSTPLGRWSPNARHPHRPRRRRSRPDAGLLPGGEPQRSAVGPGGDSGRGAEI